jgi:hypothetical protein
MPSSTKLAVQWPRRTSSGRGRRVVPAPQLAAPLAVGRAGSERLAPHQPVVPPDERAQPPAPVLGQAPHRVDDVVPSSRAQGRPEPCLRSVVHAAPGQTSRRVKTRAVSPHTMAIHSTAHSR